MHNHVLAVRGCDPRCVGRQLPALAPVALFLFELPDVADVVHGLGPLHFFNTPCGEIGVVCRYRSEALIRRLGQVVREGAYFTGAVEAVLLAQVCSSYYPCVSMANKRNSMYTPSLVARLP